MLVLMLKIMRTNCFASIPVLVEDLHFKLQAQVSRSVGVLCLQDVK